MADNKDTNSGKDDENLPLDDYGIHQDRLLEICEKIIEKTHNKYVLENYTPKSSAEFRDVAETLQRVWSITQDILNLDDVIRSAAEALTDTDDKNIDDMLDLLPKRAAYYFTNAHIERALPHQQLKDLAYSKGLKGLSFDHINDAVLHAKANCKKDEVIMVCGSFFTLAELDDSQII